MVYLLDDVIYRAGYFPLSGLFLASQKSTLHKVLLLV